MTIPADVSQLPRGDSPPDKVIAASTKIMNADKEISALTSGGEGHGTELPSRASFLGLPAELRLRIYEYLLDASRKPASELDSGVPWHCCFDEPMEGSMMCSCAKFVYPSILRVSKLVNQEATPVLYASLELRVDTPQEFSGHVSYAHVLRNLRRFDNRQTEHIASVVVATSMSQIPIRIQEDEDFADNMKPLWSELSGELFNIKDLRLYLRYDLGRYKIDEYFDYDELLGFLALPNLRKVQLDVLAPIGSPGNGAAEVAAFLDTLKQKAEDKIDGTGRDIKVIATLRSEVDDITLEDEVTDGEDEEPFPDDSAVNTQGIDLGEGHISGEEEEGGVDINIEAFIATSSDSNETDG